MESPTYPKSWKKGMNKLAVVYPNLYYGGVYCLGPLVIYNIVNQMENWFCERHFLDKNNLKDSNMIGFSFQYELDYYNFVKMLEQNSIPLEKDARKEIIFAGGPCVTTNPLTLSKYLDFMLIGECEETLPKVLEIYEKNKDKESFLKEISAMQGIFVPKYSSSPTISTIKDLDSVAYPFYQPLPKEMDETFVFGNSFILETERGCTFNCKFCPLNRFYYAPRFRSLKSIKEIIDKGLALTRRKKVVIYAPSFVHPDRKEILRYLIAKGVEVGVPSIKAEFIDRELMELMKEAGVKSVTIAPEAGERLRKLAGKVVPDKRFFDVIEWANELKFDSIKLYFLIGLPGQTTSDLDDVISFVENAKKIFKGTVYASINTMVPKMRTEYNGLPFEKAKAKQQAYYLKRKLNTKLKVANVSTSFKEWKLSNATSFEVKSKPKAIPMHSMDI